MRRFIDQLNLQARVAIVVVAFTLTILTMADGPEHILSTVQFFDGSAAHPKLEHLLSIADVQAEQCVGFVPALDIAASHP